MTPLTYTAPGQSNLPQPVSPAQPRPSPCDSRPLRAPGPIRGCIVPTPLPRDPPSPFCHSPDVRRLVQTVEAGGEGQQRHQGQQGPPAGCLEAPRAPSRPFGAPRCRLGSHVRAHSPSDLGPTAAPPGTQLGPCGASAHRRRHPAPPQDRPPAGRHARSCEPPCQELTQGHLGVPWEM